MLFTNPVLSILNKILGYNLGSVNQLKQYRDKSFCINGAGVQVSGTIDIDGFLIPCDEHTVYTVEMMIPLSVLSNLIQDDKLAMVREIKFVGDREFGLKLLEILSELRLDGAYTMVPPLGGVVLQQIEKLLRGIKNYILALSENAATSISEYLVYETRDVVSRRQIERFCDEVDELRSRVELLTQRIDCK